MTDGGADLKRLFASRAHAPEDDAFVAGVRQRIGRLGRLRKVAAVGIVLAVAASLAAFTPALLALGFFIGWAADWTSRGATWVLLSPAVASLALIVGFVYLAVRRS